MNKALRFIKNHTILYLMVKKPAKIVLGFPQILKIVKEESYFPEQERKSYLVRLIDNIIWLLKYREANRFYNLYGLDVRDRQNNEYIDYLSFMRSRDRNYKKENPWENQLVLLRDKFLFFKYMNANGLYVPEVFAVLENGELYNNSFCKIAPNELASEVDYFVKDQKGECASFVMHIKDYDDLKNKWTEIQTHNCIFQRSIKQCTAMDTLYSGAINTLRIVMVNRAGNVTVLSGVLRIGTKKTGSVDNWAKGGLVVGIWENDGCLKKHGYYKPGFGTKTDRHPDSGLEFSKFKIPQWKAALEAAVKAHKMFYGVRSIGWDIAITDSGPCFVEGNDNWEISLNQAADRGLRKAWYEAMEEKND